MAAPSSSASWKRARSSSRARARSSPPSAASSASSSATRARAARSAAEIDAAEGVEGRALARRRQQPLMGVLAVEVDEVVATLASAAAVAGRPSMYARDRPSAGTTRLSTTVVVAGADEAGVDARLGGAGADDRRVGPATDDELERLDEHRLAGTGLAGDRRQPVGDDQVDGADDAEVLDVQLAQHRLHHARSRPSCEFLLADLPRSCRRWVRGPTLGNRCGRVGDHTGDSGCVPERFSGRPARTSA